MTSPAQIDEIAEVCFVGAGTMGCYNALVAALAGYRVVLYDASPRSLADAPDLQASMAAMLVAAGACDENAVAAAKSLTRLESDLALALASAELVSESVFEDLALKREVHRELDRLSPENAILTTNSSFLLISDIEDVVARGDRVAALHSHLGSPLVDIVPGPRTSPSTLDILQRYVLSIGGEPLLLKKENPSYVFNAMLGPVIGTSLALLVSGKYDSLQIDRAWMATQQAPMGPFGMVDFFGIPMVRDSWLHRQGADALQDFREPILSLFEALIGEGRQGMKTGEGFYRYPEPEYELPVTEVDQGAANLLRHALIAQATLLVAEDVASPADVDRAWRIGAGLARGPFEQFGEQGLAASEQGINLLTEASLLTVTDAEQVIQALRELAAGQIDGRGSNG